MCAIFSNCNICCFCRSYSLFSFCWLSLCLIYWDFNSFSLWDELLLGTLFLEILWVLRWRLVPPERTCFALVSVLTQEHIKLNFQFGFFKPLRYCEFMVQICMNPQRLETNNQVLLVQKMPSRQKLATVFFYSFYFFPQSLTWTILIFLPVPLSWMYLKS